MPKATTYSKSKTAVIKQQRAYLKRDIQEFRQLETERLRLLKYRQRLNRYDASRLAEVRHSIPLRKREIARLVAGGSLVMQPGERRPRLKKKWKLKVK